MSAETNQLQPQPRNYLTLNVLAFAFFCTGLFMATTSSDLGNFSPLAVLGGIYLMACSCAIAFGLLLTLFVLDPLQRRIKLFLAQRRTSKLAEQQGG